MAHLNERVTTGGGLLCASESRRREPMPKESTTGLDSAKGAAKFVAHSGASLYFSA